MNSRIAVFGALVALACALLLLNATSGSAGTAGGAKAIFDRGDGAAVRTPSGTSAQDAPELEKYVGISYKIVLLKPNGNFSVVPKPRSFKSGERIKLLVRTNCPGHLSILSIGDAGNSTVLFSENVEARKLYEVPRSTALKFAGTPGTEKIMIMLSAGVNPIVGRKPATVADNPRGATAPRQEPSVSPSPPDGSKSSSSQGVAPPPVPAADADISPPPTAMTVSGNMQEFKGIVVEDLNRTGYAVISPRTGWKPSAAAKERIVVENDNRDGSNYGVIPASAMADGGIFTLDFKLTHR